MEYIECLIDASVRPQNLKDSSASARRMVVMKNGEYGMWDYNQTTTDHISEFFKDPSFKHMVVEYLDKTTIEYACENFKMDIEVKLVDAVELVIMTHVSYITDAWRQFSLLLAAMTADDELSNMLWLINAYVNRLSVVTSKILINYELKSKKFAKPLILVLQQISNISNGTSIGYSSPPLSILVIQSLHILMKSVEADIYTKYIIEGNRIVNKFPNKCCVWCGDTSECLKKCNGCMNVYYCDNNCAKLNWATHKKSCCITI
jgi:hypothetical protein